MLTVSPTTAMKVVLDVGDLGHMQMAFDDTAVLMMRERETGEKPEGDTGKTDVIYCLVPEYVVYLLLVLTTNLLPHQTNTSVCVVMSLLLIKLLLCVVL